MKLFNVFGIKNRRLRRVVMVAVFVPVLFEYLVAGVRTLLLDFGPCWNYQYPSESENETTVRR